MARDHFLVQLATIARAVRAKDATLGAWLRLNAYAVPLMLSGRIPDVRTLDDAECMRAFGVTRAAVDQVVAGGLAHWDGDQLELHDFDLDGEKVWLSKSAGGRVGGQRSGEVRRSGSTGNARTPSTNGSRTPSTIPSTNGSRTPSIHAPNEGVLEGPPEGVVEHPSLALPRSIAPTPLPPKGGGGGGEGSTQLDEEKRKRLDRITANGGWPRSQASGDDQTQAWLDATDGLTLEQVDAVFQASQRIVGHVLRYPDHVKTIRDQLRDEQAKRASADRREDRERQEAEAKRAHDDGIAAEHAAAAPRIREIAKELNGIPTDVVDAAAKQVSAQLFVAKLRAGQEITNNAIALPRLELLLKAIPREASDRLTKADPPEHVATAS